MVLEAVSIFPIVVSIKFINILASHKPLVLVLSQLGFRAFSCWLVLCVLFQEGRVKMKNPWTKVFVWLLCVPLVFGLAACEELGNISAFFKGTTTPTPTSTLTLTPSAVSTNTSVPTETLINLPFLSMTPWGIDSSIYSTDLAPQLTYGFPTLPVFNTPYPHPLIVLTPIPLSTFPNIDPPKPFPITLPTPVPLPSWLK